MASLYSLIIFFFILVILYSGVAAGLSLAGWIQKKWIGRREKPAPDVIRAIDGRTDRLKSKAFPIAVVLVLLCITPFVMLSLLVF